MLEHLADADETVVESLDGLGVDRDDMWGFLRDLENRGWVSLQPQRVMSLAQAYPGARLTADGAAHVDEVRSLRGDVVGRARAIRSELLLWLYGAGVSMPVTTAFLDQDPVPTFYGTPFTEADVTTAGRFLLEAGLVHGPTAWGSQGSPIRTALTGDGVRCVEDHAADPTRMRGTAHSPSVSYVQNIHQASGPVAQGDHAQAVTNHGPTPADIEALRGLLVTAVQAAENLEDAADRDELLTHVDDLVDAVRAGPLNPERVQKRANVLTRAAGRAGDVALKTATSEGTRRALEWAANAM